MPHSVEIPAPVTGTVVEIAGVPGEMLAVGSDLIIFDVDGSGNADASATLAKAQPAAAEPAAQAIAAFAAGRLVAAAGYMPVLAAAGALALFAAMMFRFVDGG